ncbi:MAG: hypothetical protein AAFU53_08360, partial [Cyanobacteria bacterium J06632_3]
LRSKNLIKQPIKRRWIVANAYGDASRLACLCPQGYTTTLSQRQLLKPAPCRALLFSMSA